jgi:hypothetical protein
MGWSVGWDPKWKRWVGYGVPAICDEPDCSVKIDRGLAYVCGSDPMGGEHGCGLYFCETHLPGSLDWIISERPDGDLEVEDAPTVDLCERCLRGQEPFEKSPDTDEWLRHLRDHESWGPWRDENPRELEELKAELGRRMGATSSSSRY